MIILDKLKITRNQLASFIKDNEAIKQFERLFLNANDLQKEVFISQVEAPATTGFTVNVGDGVNIPYDNNIRLLLNTSSTLATGTILFPEKRYLRDNQRVIITAVNEVTTLTLDINDVSTIYGAVTTISAEDSVTYMYNIETDSWARVS